MVSEWRVSIDKRVNERSKADICAIFGKLKGVKEFRDRTSDAVMRQMAAYGYFEDLESGIIVLRQGCTGESWFAVVAGSVDVMLSLTDPKLIGKKVDTMGPGCAFGDEVLENGTHPATIVTGEETQLICMKKNEFCRMWKLFPAEVEVLSDPLREILDRHLPPPAMIQSENTNGNNAGDNVEKAKQNGCPSDDANDSGLDSIPPNGKAEISSIDSDRRSRINKLTAVQHQKQSASTTDDGGKTGEPSLSKQLHGTVRFEDEQRLIEQLEKVQLERAAAAKQQQDTKSSAEAAQVDSTGNVDGERPSVSEPDSDVGDQSSKATGKGSTAGNRADATGMNDYSPLDDPYSSSYRSELSGYGQSAIYSDEEYTRSQHQRPLHRGEDGFARQQDARRRQRPRIPDGGSQSTRRQQEENNYGTNGPSTSDYLSSDDHFREANRDDPTEDRPPRRRRIRPQPPLTDPPVRREFKTSRRQLPEHPSLSGSVTKSNVQQRPRDVAGFRERQVGNAGLPLAVESFRDRNLLDEYEFDSEDNTSRRERWPTDRDDMRLDARDGFNWTEDEMFSDEIDVADGFQRKDRNHRFRKATRYRNRPRPFFSGLGSSRSAGEPSTSMFTSGDSGGEFSDPAMPVRNTGSDPDHRERVRGEPHHFIPQRRRDLRFSEQPPHQRQHSLAAITGGSDPDESHYQHGRTRYFGRGDLKSSSLDVSARRNRTLRVAGRMDSDWLSPRDLELHRSLRLPEKHRLSHFSKSLTNLPSGSENYDSYWDGKNMQDFDLSYNHYLSAKGGTHGSSSRHPPNARYGSRLQRYGRSRRTESTPSNYSDPVPADFEPPTVTSPLHWTTVAASTYTGPGRKFFLNDELLDIPAYDDYLSSEDPFQFLPPDQSSSARCGPDQPYGWLDKRRSKSDALLASSRPVYLQGFLQSSLNSERSPPSWDDAADGYAANSQLRDVQCRSTSPVIRYSSKEDSAAAGNFMVDPSAFTRTGPSFDDYSESLAIPPHQPPMFSRNRRFNRTIRISPVYHRDDPYRAEHDGVYSRLGPPDRISHRVEGSYGANYERSLEDPFMYSGGRVRGGTRKLAIRRTAFRSPSAEGCFGSKFHHQRMSRAGRVLRAVMLLRSSQMIRDRMANGVIYPRTMVGVEMVDWLTDLGRGHITTRTHAVGAWQALVEEGCVMNVTYEYTFVDQHILYRWAQDDGPSGDSVIRVPPHNEMRDAEQELESVLSSLSNHGPDALFRMVLQKRADERTADDIEFVYEDMLQINAFANLSTMVKRELARVLMFEHHTHAGEVIFKEGEEGKSWYIILKGSVNVVKFGKGIVCTLHEGDDFGKLALMNEAPRSATIVLREGNCQLLRVDRPDFNRILRDVEENTVRLKEHGQDVLVLERIPVKKQDSPEQVKHRYSVMAGTPEKMLEYLLETRIDSQKDESLKDTFLEDFLLTHLIFLPTNVLCTSLMVYYRQGCSVTNTKATMDPTSGSVSLVGLPSAEMLSAAKRRVVAFAYAWSLSVARHTFFQDSIGNSFVEELYCAIIEDAPRYTDLRAELAIMERLMQEREDAMKANTRRSAVVLDCGQLRTNSDSLIRPFDTSILKIYIPGNVYTTLKIRMDQIAGNILALAVQKLGIPANESTKLVEVRSSGEKVVFGSREPSISSMLSLNGRLFIVDEPLIHTLMPLPEQEGPSENLHQSSLDHITSVQLAYHMALFHWELFVNTHEYEYVYQVLGRDSFGQGRVPSNLDILIRRFNQVQYWVPTEVLLCPGLHRRTQLLKKFIKLAAQAKAYQDLFTFYAVVLGLSNISVSRLRNTWDKLPNKFKKMFVEFEAILDPSRNHRAYRLLVAKLRPPVIPFVPLVLKDLTFAHEGNKTYFDGLLNFEKMHMLAQSLRGVRLCKSRQMLLEAPVMRHKFDIQSFIRNFPVIDNQRRLTQLSYELEPKKIM